MTKKITYCWHLLPSNKRLAGGDSRLVKQGKWMEPRNPSPVVWPCSNTALHAAPSYAVAARYFWTPFRETEPHLCYVALEDAQMDWGKYAGRRRLVLWAVRRSAALNAWRNTQTRLSFENWLKKQAREAGRPMTLADLER